MTTILNGVLGGLVAGVVASVLIRVVDGDSSAMGVLRERPPGDGVGTSRWGASAVQVVYGGVAGGLLVALELFVLGVLAVPPSSGEVLVVAIVWSALLFGILVVIWWLGTSHPLDRSPLRGLFVYHLVYGIVLGVWIWITWIT